MRRAAGATALSLALVGVGVFGLTPSRAMAQADLTYKIYCSRCHGDNGHGDGADGATLKTRPRDFTDCAVIGKISDETMFKAIKEGGESVGLSGDMPAWGSGLSDDDIHAVMKYVRGFCQK